jgi:hypothetical protein
MVGKLRINIKLCLFLIIICLFAFSVCSGYIFSSPDPWFDIEKITFDETTIPVGVELLEYKIEYGRVKFNIINTNPNPIYLLNKVDSEYNPIQNLSLPDGYYAIIRHTSDGKKANYRNHYNNTNESVWINSHVSWSDLSRIYVLDGPSKLVSEDNRPDDVIIPSPQNFTLFSAYNEDLYEIKGQVHYKLHENYNPTAGEKEPYYYIYAGDDNYELIYYIVAGVIILIIGSITFYIAFIKKRKLKD